MDRKVPLQNWRPCTHCTDGTDPDYGDECIYCAGREGFAFDPVTESWVPAYEDECQ